MRNQVCAVVAAVLVTFGVIGCSAAASKPSQPATPAITSPGGAIRADCTPGQLGAALEGSSQPGVGDTALGIVYLWDKSAAACALGGPVTITGLNRTGRQVTRSIRFTMPALMPARLTPDGTRPGKRGRMPACEVAASMLLIAAGTQPNAGVACPGRLIDPALWRLTLASGGSLTTPNASAVSGPTLTSGGGLATCRGNLSGQSPLLFEQG